MISMTQPLFKAILLLKDGNSAMTYINAENIHKALDVIKQSKEYSLAPVLVNEKKDEAAASFRPLIEVTGLKLSLWERFFPLHNFRNCNYNSENDIVQVA
jgi:hypothetical protein